MKQLALDIGMASGPTLASFRPGPNRAALDHLLLWLAPPVRLSRSPVPTYLWGATGSGKSHLLTAMRQALSQRGELVGWMDPSVSEPPAFNDAWSAVLIDDVDRLQALQQHVAFSWMVQAQTADCAILVAGNAPPADLCLREDLRTRLGWGHVFALHPLGEAERRAVLRQSADARGIFLSDEVMDYMLSRFTRDLGNLVALLDELDAFSLQAQRPITVPLLKRMLDAA
jgi:DnaA family protein